MSQLTVYFDDPFWVGVFERIERDHLETCRVIFGTEPKDKEHIERIALCMSKCQRDGSFDRIRSLWYTVPKEVI